MKLANLKALIAAVDHASLRAAARHLGVSQPALTKALRDLELELGVPLLLRSSLGVTPTAQGKVLHAHALKVMRELGLATERIKQLSGDMVGELSVAAVPLAVLLLIPETIRTFSREFPQVHLRLTEELYMAQMQRLRNGEVDVAIGGIPSDLANGEFTVEPLMTTTMVPVVNRSSPYAKAGALSELVDASWVYTGATHADGYARKLFELHGLPAPKVGAMVNSTLALISLVSNGHFIGLMPEQIAHQPLGQEHLSVIPIRERGIQLNVGAMTRKDVALGPIVRHFLMHLHRAANHYH
jgi:LysR family transcriptional regulator, regulator of abg operon